MRARMNNMAVKIGNGEATIISENVTPAGVFGLGDSLNLGD